MSPKLDKEYNRGMKHGMLNVYNPGVLYGEELKRYKAGYKEGKRRNLKKVEKWKIAS